MRRRIIHDSVEVAFGNATMMMELDNDDDGRSIHLLPSQHRNYRVNSSNTRHRNNNNSNTRNDYAWLAVFCATGVGLGMSFEYLDLQSNDGHSPAAAETFFLCFIGYWSQTIVGGGYVFFLWIGHRKQQHQQQLYSSPPQQQQQQQQQSTIST
eukprot:CAMPEP_0170939898 /NCGR_PEP_ID=MMETSP0735-20130129/22288_1 /TAXON_ID=186038 /ORGANISM="Fragilariopsis kerguelensis, Strain L26-C5" /LENGTH=152 /DNA_ID=CAMNT_0011345527 /DNA_START=12 /DNA_END=467 /DNA_ORIENTATION=-